MFTTPFTFMAKPVGGWTPANFSNLWDWWTASSGITLSAGKIDSWTGYNGNSLVPYNGSYKATLTSTDSNFNNQPSVRINPTFASVDAGYRCALDGIAKTGTVLLLCYINNKSGSDAGFFANSMDANRYAAFSNAGGTDVLTYNLQASPQIVYAGSNISTGQYVFLRGDYNYTSGGSKFYQSNTNIFTNLISTLNVAAGFNFNTANLILGGYQNVYGLSNDLSVVEFVKIDGIPSNIELTKFSSYITTKYNL